MEGRPGQRGDSWDKTASQRLAALNGTSKHRAMPQRPPGMARLETAPEMPRVPRPQRRTTPPPRNIRRRWIIVGSLFGVVAIIACTIGYLLASGIFASAGPANTVTDFVGALSSRNYDQAYKDLGPAITIPTSPQVFKQQAQALDTCYGAVTDTQSNGATNNGDSQTYTVTITRSKLSKPYNIQLTLKQTDPNNASSWKISSYGGTLGPTPAPACSK